KISEDGATVMAVAESGDILGFIKLKDILGFFASAIRYLHHIPEDDPNSFRVKNFKLIYSLIIVLGILLPILFGFLLLIILIVPVIWHIIKLPEDIESISQKTYQIVLLHILGTLLIIIQLYI
ncbi:MAG: hypothetical protein QW752_04625, partial [Thermoplasmata archaeon]